MRGTCVRHGRGRRRDGRQRGGAASTSTTARRRSHLTSPSTAPTWPTLLDGVLLDLAPVVARPAHRRAGRGPRRLPRGHRGRPAAPGHEPLLRPPDDRDAARSRVRDDDGHGLATSFATVAPCAVQLGVPRAVVDGTALHDAGASDAQELGWTIATGVAYLRLAHRRRASPSTRPRGLLEFRYAVTDEQFPTIAKLRAARRLWARVLEASGAATSRRRQHAVTSRADDQQVRPLGEHAARHRRRLRRRRRRRRRGHRASPSTSGSALPDALGRRDRPQHLLAADRGVARRRGHRPGRRLLRRREAHRRPRRRRLGRARPDRGRRWRASASEAARRASRNASRAVRAARDAGRRPLAARSPASRSSRTSARCCPSASPCRGRYGRATTAGPSRTCATEPADAPGLPRHDGPDRRRTPRAPPSPPTCSPPAVSPSRPPARPPTSPRCSEAYARPARRVPRGHRRGLRRVGCRPRGGAACGRSVVRRPGRQAGGAHRRPTWTTRAPWGSTRSASWPGSERSSPDEHPEELRRREPRCVDGLVRPPPRVDRRGQRAVEQPGGDRRPPGLRPRAPRGPRRPRHVAGPRAVPARALPDDVHHPAVDDPAVRRLLDRRGVQRVLPPQPRGGPEGPARRLRPRHPPRLRLRPPARARRRRHGGRGDRLDLRHPHALRRHPARRDVGVDDDERRRAARCSRSTSRRPRSRG